MWKKGADGSHPGPEGFKAALLFSVSYTHRNIENIMSVEYKMAQLSFANDEGGFCCHICILTLFPQ